MEILEDENGRPVLGKSLDEAAPRRERLAAPVRSRGVLGDADERPQHRTHPLEVLITADAGDRLLKLRLCDACRIALEDPGFGLDHFTERPIGHAFAVRKRAALTPACQLGLGLEPDRQLLYQPALSHAGNADDRHELRLVLGTRPRERVEQLIELAPPADETRHRLQVDVDSKQRPCRDRLPNRDGLLFSLCLDRLTRAVVDVFVRRSVCLLADEDSVDGRRRLQASGRVDHIAGHQALTGVGTRVDGDERLAGIHRESHVNGVFVQRPVADRQRGSHRALRVVFVDDRRPEHRHDGIADELLDRSAATFELRANASVVRRQLRAHVLGIRPLRARRRSDEVAEHDGDDLSLLDRPRRRSEARSALGAELRPCLVL